MAYDALVFDLNGTLWLDCPTRTLSAGPHPASVDVLTLLAKDYPLYIVSNCHPHQLEDYLRVFKANPFKETVHFGKYGTSKQANLEALKSIYNFQRPLYVGDSPSDQKAAQRAGYAFVWAAYCADGFEILGEKIKDLEDLILFLKEPVDEF
jgi:phosphoglycolate phosphatase-like HAD superfamily hydrolase